MVMVVMNVVYTLSSWPAGALSDRSAATAADRAGFALLIARRSGAGARQRRHRR